MYHISKQWLTCIVISSMLLASTPTTVNTMSRSDEEIIQRATPSPMLSEKLKVIFDDKEVFSAFVRRENIMTNAQRRALAIKYNMTKLAAYNYVFRTPLVPGFILKMGPIHWSNSFGGFAIRTVEVTNKNVSRVAYQQLIEDVIQRNKLKHIRVVKKYLYQVTEKKTLCDGNYIVVVEDMERELLGYKENIERFSILSDEEREELQIIARQAYFADLKPENCIFGKDGFMYLIDTEQTNKAKETDFFLNNKEQMAQDAAIGLQRIEALKKFKEREYLLRYLKRESFSYQYCQMGIEPDDRATVTQEAISIRDQTRL